MKEHETRMPEPTEQLAQVQAKKQKQFKGRILLRPGHTVFEIDLITGITKPATYESAQINFATQSPIRNLVERENCIYVPALNIRNAKRHFDNIVKKVTKKK